MSKPLLKLKEQPTKWFSEFAFESRLGVVWLQVLIPRYACLFHGVRGHHHRLFTASALNDLAPRASSSSCPAVRPIKTPRKLFEVVDIIDDALFS